MKLLSWNVNGLRALLRKGGFAFLPGEDPDLLCLQEVRARSEQVGPLLPEYPFQYWNHAERPGYSGTACFSKTEALEVSRGMGKAVLLVSADLDEVLSLSDRIGVIYKGKIIREFRQEEATKELVGLYMMGEKGNG